MYVHPTLNDFTHTLSNTVYTTSLLLSGSNLRLYAAGVLIRGTAPHLARSLCVVCMMYNKCIAHNQDVIHLSLRFVLVDNYYALR